MRKRKLESSSWRKNGYRKDEGRGEENESLRKQRQRRWHSKMANRKYYKYKESRIYYSHGQRVEILLLKYSFKNSLSEWKEQPEGSVEKTSAVENM